jgi:hypothetical protein
VYPNGADLELALTSFLIYIDIFFAMEIFLVGGKFFFFFFLR